MKKIFKEGGKKKEKKSIVLFMVKDSLIKPLTTIYCVANQKDILLKIVF